MSKSDTSKDAWEIGLNDTAIVAIEPDDEPFIPENKKDIAPVLEVMAIIREFKKTVKDKKHDKDKNIF